MTLLDAVIFLPLAAFLIILALPKENFELIRRFSLGASVVTFVASLGLIGPYWFRNPGKFVFDTDLPWIASPPIHYHVAIDGISLWLVILSTLLTPICVLVSWRYIDKYVKQFFAFLLLLEFGLVGVFCALDFFLFYVFWEVSLVPMYFLIGIWGHERRIYSAVKFFLYTMTGSVLMLVGIIYLYNQSGTFDYPRILAGLQSGSIALSSQAQLLLFLAFFAAFAIKVPLFPLHTWLPDAHVEAPTAGSVMLASVMLKMGTYGLLRYCVPMFPAAARDCAGWIVTLAIIGIIYGALVAMVQPDLKKLVAYSSVSHLGFVVLGIASMNVQGVQGAVYQMLNHGVSTGGLFLLVGMLSDRRHTRLIEQFGGLKKVTPHLVAAFLLVTLSSIGLPGLNGFVGEFLILLGSFRSDVLGPRMTAFAATGVILSATYMLWMFQRVNYGVVTHEENRNLPDLDRREWTVIVPIIAMTVVMGVLPNLFLKPMAPSVDRVLSLIHREGSVRAEVRQRSGAGR
ncbi:MAG TPA: NADH-quinone oxidoreductase subunit M [Bryobacteraceae bacterium]|nr:NADH-quinone oxidoreductase subunit M [Bryobacteraceae bacterium]